MSKNWKQWVILGIAILSFAGITYASTSFSISIGTDNFYASVGNYDYFPYAYSEPGYGYPPPRISFYDVMSDYGNWVYVAPFGQVWRPYADPSWRPYVQGHWIYTSYGPTWVGYEPWAWAAYHYGNWIWTQRFGWVWIPGYQWHPGRVIWSHGYDAIGWMPAPPDGYDYSQGYLSYQGDYNQFSYNDDDFDYGSDSYGGYGQGNYYYGGPYYDPRYRDLYYNPGYRNIEINLWVFIGSDHFGYTNYSDYYLDQDFTRTVFERRLVRISSRPLDRPILERVVRQRIVEVPVRVKEIDTDKQRVKLVVPEGEDKDIRENANKVVKQVIAPGFVAERKNFKGLQARNAQQINRVFQQENKRPEIRTVSGDELVQEVKKVESVKVEQRNRLVREKADRVVQIEREGKIHESKNQNRGQKNKNENNDQNSQFQNGRSNKKDHSVEQNESGQNSPSNNEELKKKNDTRQNQNRDSQFETGNKNKSKQKEQDLYANPENKSGQNDQQDRNNGQQKKSTHDRGQDENQNIQKGHSQGQDQGQKESGQVEQNDNQKQSQTEVSDQNSKQSDNSNDKQNKQDSGKKNKKKDSKDKKHHQNSDNNPDNNQG